ncbi:hypothetical protein CsSME_00039596 [Camellia sinensis var. sinensis]
MSITRAIVFQHYRLPSNTKVMSIPLPSQIIQGKIARRMVMMESFSVTLAKKRRDLALPTYYCTDRCQYIAHPHCVVSEIIHILEEEWSKHENVKEPLAVTLKEFLDSYTENENKEMHGLFESYGRDVQEGAILPKIFLSLYEDVDEDRNKIHFKIKFAIARLAKLVRAHFGLQADLDVLVDLNLAGLVVPFAKQLVVKDSKELAIIEKNGETNSTQKKVDKLQQTITKLDETIKELEKKKHALDNKKQKNALVKKKQALEKKR